jgi:hypothetical protein
MCEGENPLSHFETLWARQKVGTHDLAQQTRGQRLYCLQGLLFANPPAIPSDKLSGYLEKVATILAVVVNHLWVAANAWLDGSNAKIEDPRNSSPKQIPRRAVVACLVLLIMTIIALAVT